MCRQNAVHRFGDPPCLPDFTKNKLDLVKASVGLTLGSGFRAKGLGFRVGVV